MMHFSGDVELKDKYIEKLMSSSHHCPIESPTGFGNQVHFIDQNSSFCLAAHDRLPTNLIVECSRDFMSCL